MSAISTSGHEKLWTSKTWPFIVSVLVLMTLIAFESFAITTVLPVAMADLGGTQWYSLAYAATITAALVGMVVGGNWCDRSGPRRPLMVGGTTFLAGIALCVVAPDSMTFILGRFLQGIGGGIDSVVLYVLIARRIPEGPRPSMFGLLSAAWLVPSLAGPVAAGALAAVISWRAVFGLVLVGAAVALLSLLHTTRGTNAPEHVSGQRIIGRNGALSLVAALLLVVLHFGGQLDPPLTGLVVGAALIGLLAAVRGVLPRGTLLLRGVPQRLVAMRAMLAATSAATNLYLTLYLQTERGYLPTIAGLAIAGSATGWALGAWIQGRYSSEHALHWRLIRLGIPLVSVGPMIALLYVTVGLPLWGVVGGCITMGLGMGITYARISSATLALAHTKEQGAYSSALQAGESITLGAVTALTALMLTSAGTSDTGFPVVYAALTALASIAITIAWVGGLRHSSTRY